MPQRHGVSLTRMLGACVVLGAMVSAAATGQTPSISRPGATVAPRPVPVQPVRATPPPGPLLKLGNTNEWLLELRIDLWGWGATLRNMNDRPALDTTGGKLYLPMPGPGAGCEPIDEQTSVALFYDERPVESPWRVVPGTPGGARVAEVDLPAQGVYVLRAIVKMRWASSEVAIDERAVMEQPWPTRWPADAAETLEPIYLLDWLTSPDQTAPTRRLLQRVLAQWLNGRDPRTMSPALLAKTILGQLVERLGINETGKIVNNDGAFAGIDVRHPLHTLESMGGSEEDIATLYTALCRAAGLPARVIVGWEVPDTTTRTTPDGRTLWRTGVLRTWSEFALVDPQTGKTLWIPVDPLRQRTKQSNRAPAIENPWLGFGNHSDMDRMVPVSVGFIPQVRGTSAALPALWSWSLPKQSGPLRLERQSLYFSVQPATMTVKDMERRRRTP